jgi:hypothetical protein
MIRALAGLAPLALGVAACAPASPIDLIPPEDLALIEAAERRDAAEAQAAALRAQTVEAEAAAARRAVDAASADAAAAGGDARGGDPAAGAAPTGATPPDRAAAATPPAGPISVEEMLARVRSAAGTAAPAQRTGREGAR